jgi:hypothetical protein
MANSFTPQLVIGQQYQKVEPWKNLVLSCKEQLLPTSVMRTLGSHMPDPCSNRILDNTFIIMDDA